MNSQTMRPIFIRREAPINIDNIRISKGGIAIESPQMIVGSRTSRTDTDTESIASKSPEKYDYVTEWQKESSDDSIDDTYVDTDADSKTLFTDIRPDIRDLNSASGVESKTSDTKQDLTHNSVWAETIEGKKRVISQGDLKFDLDQHVMFILPYFLDTKNSEADIEYKHELEHKRGSEYKPGLDYDASDNMSSRELLVKNRPSLTELPIASMKILTGTIVNINNVVVGPNNDIPRETKLRSSDDPSRYTSKGSNIYKRTKEWAKPLIARSWKDSNVNTIQTMVASYDILLDDDFWVTADEVTYLMDYIKSCSRLPYDYELKFSRTPSERQTESDNLPTAVSPKSKSRGKSSKKDAIESVIYNTITVNYRYIMGTVPVCRTLMADIYRKEYLSITISDIENYIRRLKLYSGVCVRYKDYDIDYTDKTAKSDQYSSPRRKETETSSDSNINSSRGESNVNKSTESKRNSGSNKNIELINNGQSIGTNDTNADLVNFIVIDHICISPLDIRFVIKCDRDPFRILAITNLREFDVRSSYRTSYYKCFHPLERYLYDIIDPNQTNFNELSTVRTVLHSIFDPIKVYIVKKSLCNPSDLEASVYEDSMGNVQILPKGNDSYREQTAHKEPSSSHKESNSSYKEQSVRTKSVSKITEPRAFVQNKTGVYTSGSFSNYNIRYANAGYKYTGISLTSYVKGLSYPDGEFPTQSDSYIFFHSKDYYELDLDPSRQNSTCGRRSNTDFSYGTTHNRSSDINSSSDTNSPAENTFLEFVCTSEKHNLFRNPVPKDVILAVPFVCDRDLFRGKTNLRWFYPDNEFRLLHLYVTTDGKHPHFQDSAGDLELLFKLSDTASQDHPSNNSNNIKTKKSVKKDVQIFKPQNQIKILTRKSNPNDGFIKLRSGFTGHYLSIFDLFIYGLSKKNPTLHSEFTRTFASKYFWWERLSNELLDDRE